MSLHCPSISASISCWTLRGVESVCCLSQALMQPSRQSVEEVKRVVAEARHKVQRPPTNANGTFNEEDFMDGDLVDEDMA